jgi:signal transduction histidine kinase
MLRMLMARPRARIWILSVAAVLLPAAGIAYLGAQAYGGERGAVAQRIGDQQRAARALAAWLEAELARTLAAAEAGGAGGPLATYAFRIDAAGELVAPDPSPFGAVADRDRGGPVATPCAERGLEACIREARTQEQRVRQLVRARASELGACSGAACGAQRGEARKLYVALARYADTGPDALLGLARLARGAGDHAAARAALDQLATRFADSDVDGAPVALVAAVALGELDPEPARVLALYRRIVGGEYAAPAPVLDAALARVGRLLDGLLLAADLAAERAGLDAERDRMRHGARVARGLAPDVGELFAAATAEPRSRVAAGSRERTLVYRRTADGGVVGIAVDAAMLVAAVPPSSLAGIAPAARAQVLPVGSAPAPALRTLAQVPIGAVLPHLTIAIVNLVADPDPLDDLIRERARRHVVLTTALAVVLVAGLLATIRGAARERELARLKSDFVSTVSHELKTPLTSIRMFAEMLEQGVAAGDAERTARYHGVIVKESQRLGLLIANLLDYAQIERGSRRYTPTRERAGEVARTAADTFTQLGRADAAGGPAIAVTVAPAAADAEAMIDRDVVIQAILNLLANAAKYGKGTPIDVAVDVAPGAAGEPGAVVIAVTDRGPGIPAGEHDRIFREFYRAPEAYSSGVEGTGLGLALVKRHVEAQGGQVGVDSQPGRGATFTIRLPLAGPAEVVA